MLIEDLCKRSSYQAINGILSGVELHDLQGIDVLKMIANKRGIVIYDTGTGKTLLAAAVMKLLIREDPSRLFIMFVKKDQLIQTPKKLKDMANLSCLVTTSESAKVDELLSHNLVDYNVLILTHECLNNKKMMDAIYNIRDKVAGLIIDEAHEYNNFNSAASANMLKAMVSRFEFVWGLTATPIVSNLMQLARLANLIDTKKYPNPEKLYRDLVKGSFKLDYDPAFFINRKASELGRTSEPRGYVVSVNPHPSQVACTVGGVELFQICKGDGAINQAKALIELIENEQSNGNRGLIYISQTTVLSWVRSNLDKTSIRYTCINGGTAMEERGVIEEKFANGEYDVILTSVTAAVDLDCDYVVFYEFTVMVSQMIGRAHRGLVPKELRVYFIITKNTREEEYFVNNIWSKCQIVKEILGKGSSAVEEAAEQMQVK